MNIVRCPPELMRIVCKSLDWGGDVPLLSEYSAQDVGCCSRFDFYARALYEIKSILLLGVGCECLRCVH